VERKTTCSEEPQVVFLFILRMLRQDNGLPALTPTRALQLITISAIDRPVAARQKRHLGLIATAGAGHGVQLARLSFA
jgi:hypothetical protein